ncbi:hypothetical protein [Cyclobacterium plantarum]|uniref:Uncharacterized protein n=1 Tax=Cyclobacterium plantarum TaxID=2716263 RepID=A0ABX0HIT6_9BACT|nr:hypothetical protein [Cyclobacterium plantarum]NHE59990.1 hypothetical protein [Cyclobacterium plantarum]
MRNLVKLHQDSESLLSISDRLTKYKIESIAILEGEEKFDQLPLLVRQKELQHQERKLAKILSNADVFEYFLCRSRKLTNSTTGSWMLKKIFNKMTIKNLSILCFLSIVVFQPTHVFSQYKLIKSNEFKIDSFLPVEIIDYYSQKGIYLAYINKPENTEILLLDEDGNILVQKDLLGEGPNQSVASLNSMAFTDEGNIWIQTPFQVLLYDQNLNLKKRDKYLARTQVYLHGNMRLFSFFFQNDVPDGFSFITNPSGVDWSVDNRDFKNRNLIEIFQPEFDKQIEFAAISDREVSKQIDKSIGPLYFPIYFIDRSMNKLYLVTSFDNEITIYDLNSLRLESHIKIEHEEFKALKNSEITRNNLSTFNNIITLTARNHKILKLDNGIIILNYIREISPITYEKEKSEDPTYHHFKDPSYHRLIIFDQFKQLSGDMPMPKNGKLMINLPGNKLLFQISDPEVEEDFIGYEIYEIVKN